VIEKYPKQVKLVFKTYPLRQHKFAKTAAIAAFAAGKQGKFWEFHDLLFKNYKRLNKEKINEIARLVQLDLEQFKRDRKSVDIMKRIQRDLSDAAKAGVRSTPSVFVNGKRLRSLTMAGFKKVIEKELRKKETGQGD
jgi:protein-disulfide isomerase